MDEIIYRAEKPAELSNAQPMELRFMPTRKNGKAYQGINKFKKHRKIECWNCGQEGHVKANGINQAKSTEASQGKNQSQS